MLHVTDHATNYPKKKIDLESIMQAMNLIHMDRGYWATFWFQWSVRVNGVHTVLFQWRNKSIHFDLFESVEKSKKYITLHYIWPLLVDENHFVGQLIVCVFLFWLFILRLCRKKVNTNKKHVVITRDIQTNKTDLFDLERLNKAIIQFCGEMIH